MNVVKPLQMDEQGMLQLKGIYLAPYILSVLACPTHQKSLKSYTIGIRTLFPPWRANRLYIFGGMNYERY